MKTENVRVAAMNSGQKRLISALSPVERREALLEAASKKIMEEGEIRKTHQGLGLDLEYLLQEDVEHTRNGYGGI